MSTKALRPALEEKSFRPILDYVEGSNFRLELTAAQVMGFDDEGGKRLTM